MAELRCIDLGRGRYLDALALQERLVAEVLAAEDERACVVLVEHDPPVVTLGRRADPNHVLADAEKLAAHGIERHETSRGGDVTYHGPGQLVAYPILRVDRHGRDVHRYVRDLEQVVINVLAEYGVDAGRRERLTGVWIGRRKVAAIGIAVKRWVSYHGLALNVCPDLSHFDLIVPCGLSDESVTSMAELLGCEISVDEVKPRLLAAMVNVFGFDGVVNGG